MDADIFRVALGDFFGQKNRQTNNSVHISQAIEWLKRAQDISTDGGVAAWYSLITGWAPSYIETTGYIIDTFLDTAKYLDDQQLVKRAIKMADFLLAMQLKSGGLRTHVLSHRRISPPTVFNTGQDLLGLTSIYQVTKRRKYLAAARRAADFLCGIQEKNGAWLKYTYGSMVHTYHTRVAWGLLKVHRLTKEPQYKLAAMKNLDWAVNNQQTNGWFSQNQLPPPNPKVPYTHTISYAIEGLLWSGLLLRNKKYIQAAVKGAQPLVNITLKNQMLMASYDSNWQTRDHYSCLTGTAQLALIFLKIYQVNHIKRYKSAGLKLINWLKTIQSFTSTNPNINGAVKGSWPIYGDLLKNSGYCRLAYPNWAVKFFVDALLEAERL